MLLQFIDADFSNPLKTENEVLEACIRPCQLGHVITCKYAQACSDKFSLAIGFTHK